MSDFWCLRRDESFTREQLVDVYDQTLADLLQRYDELMEQSTYVSRRHDLALKKRIEMLYDMILDLYVSLRSLR